MTAGSLALLFFGVITPLSIVGYFLGKRKAALITTSGIHMHSQSDQYGWLSFLSVIIPAITVAVVGILFSLFGFDAIPKTFLVAAALAMGALSLIIGLKMIKPEIEARNIVESVIRKILFLASMISVLTTFGILISIIFESIRFFNMQSFWYFITGTQWSTEAAFLEGAGRAEDAAGAAKAMFGSVPLFAGTFMITFIAMLIAVPFGLFSAIYLSQYATPQFRNSFKPIMEMLAGIPTVVYGFFAAITVAPLVVNVADFFGLEASFNNALAPGIVMGIMIIPIISSLSDDVISSVPRSMKEGSYALGMTTSETIKDIILPSAMPGIIAAVLLGVSRALGETMIVVMAAGLRPNLTWNPLEDLTTVTVIIVDALTGDQEFDSALTLSAFALGLVLFFVTLVINTISVYMIKRFKEKYKVSNL
ncbi:MAG: phosphate ABC transporter permease subunit PstC [Epsilonproteobacteria bacterium]|nr:phosphate ABC transporter permease subunit PstC [Campylobacterota bacterium]